MCQINCKNFLDYKNAFDLSSDLFIKKVKYYYKHNLFSSDYLFWWYGEGNRR